jgi:hypothetical protein
MKNYGYDDARIHQIIRPQKPLKGREFDRWVASDSDVWQRKYFTQLRRYQSMECRDGMMMDESDECWEFAVAYSFLGDYYDRRSEELRYWLIGAACFSVEARLPVLEFCWLHPFYRGRGLLKRAWPDFVDRFGEFYVSTPRTSAMRGFLTSVGYEDPKMDRE